MVHLIISREYPPSPYPAGGIGTYVAHMADLLAASGETVHVIGQQWPGAPRSREVRAGGRLIVHRVPLEAGGDWGLQRELLADLHGAVPFAGFLLNAARLSETLVDTADVDLIEAQDYEAPAYVLLLRRSLGMGPARRVPIVVHLHTPTEMVFEANEWPRDLLAAEPIAALERSAIRAADAVLCPSQFLASRAEARYELEPGSVHVIPYPIGPSARLERDEDTWRSGTICYAGRLEPRKGVLEWTEAAASVAGRAPARFVFVGGDVPLLGSGGGSVLTALHARIPSELAAQFEFTGGVPRPQLAAHLRRARIAVVPSRFENFPYACVEAMASGLPVLASATGGMAEMIEDGRTGWIASSAAAGSLEATLERALATPPHTLAAMGAAAVESIRRLCDNQQIAARQMEFRRAVVARGCRTTSEMPLPATDIAAARSSNAQGSTMGLLDIVRASPRQQLAVLRRAVNDPAYVGRWVAWQARRQRSRIADRLNF